MFQWMMLPYRKLYALIAGRSSRSEFWWFFLFNIIVVLLLLVLLVSVAGSLSSLQNLSSLGPQMLGAGAASLLLLVIPLYVWLILTSLAFHAVVIRRFHDFNVTGWAYLAFLILSVVVGGATGYAWLPFVGLLAIMCIKGSDGPNKYDAVPHGPVSNAEVFA